MKATGRHRTILRKVRVALTRPRNKWYALIISKSDKFASYIASDPDPGTEMIYVIGKYATGYFVMIATGTGGPALRIAEFQVDSGEIHFVTDCVSDCTAMIPLESQMFGLLRAGKNLRFGGEIDKPPLRDFRTVSLDGIDTVLDEIST